MKLEIIHPTTKEIITTIFFKEDEVFTIDEDIDLNCLLKVKKDID